MKSEIFGKIGGILNRAASRLSLAGAVALANSWRGDYNPLRGLTMRKLVHMLEAGDRGAYAEIQWLYRHIERSDAMLGAVIELRTAALQEMTWSIRISEDVSDGEASLAEQQQEALREAYKGIANLTEAIEHLAMASFREFAHLEVIKSKSGPDGEGGRILELCPVEQWFWVRDGISGEWQYNQTAKFGAVRGEPVTLSNFIIREVARPINRVAAAATVRKGLSQKDWDGFVESYGIDPLFFEMPDGISPDKVDEYLEIAEQVASDTRGVLPPGAKVQTINAGGRGVNPFRQHIDYQDETIVLRATGGLLTVLARSGSGTLAGGAHQETFERIAASEAAKISELISKAIDPMVLEREFPGAPQLAKFTIEPEEQEETTSVVENIERLAKAGYRVSASQVEAKTGFEVEDEEEEETEESEPESEPVLERLQNRRVDVEDSRFMDAAAMLVTDAQLQDWEPIRIHLETALQAGSIEDARAAFSQLLEVYPDVIVESDHAAAAFDALQSAAWANGFQRQREMGGAGA